jgi:prevent-host-death family protein
MFNTHAHSVRDLRNNYPELARLAKNHNQIIITNNGRAETVLLGIDDYRAYEDFLHERYVVQKLKEAEEQVGDSSTQWLSHSEVFSRINEKYGI